MRIAAIQFPTSCAVGENLNRIEEGLSEAAMCQARLLITPECALCGYPPIEVESVSDIDFGAQTRAIEQLRHRCEQQDVHLIVGMVRQCEEEHRNSMVLISPGRQPRYYDKRALWGWDKDNFRPGDAGTGTWEIEGTRIGVRICFEVRFPEYFRELYRDQVDVALVCFADVSQHPNDGRYATIRSHLITRAVENAFHVVSVNSMSASQTAPTCAIEPDGNVKVEAQKNTDMIITYDVVKHNISFGQRGRRHVSDQLLGLVR